MKQVEWTQGQEHPVMGDDLYRGFVKWMEVTGKDPYPTLKEALRTFVEWLLTTGDGSVALRRINEFPRQLFLPFTDDDRPWRVHERDEPS